jgi:hypothetical protein
VWGRFHICGRLGEMAEVAAAVTFLASADAAFINATDLKVMMELGQEEVIRTPSRRKTFRRRVSRNFIVGFGSY